MKNKLEKREYNKSQIKTVLRWVKDNQPVTINEIIFNFGEEIDEESKQAIDILYEKGIINCKDSFKKTHINYNPWDTITYDLLSESYLKVNNNNQLYINKNIKKLKEESVVNRIV